MKVCDVIHTFNDSKGGKEIFAWNLTEHLLEQGDEVHTISNQFETIDHPRAEFLKVPMFGKSLGIHYPVFSYFAHRALKSRNPDIVLTHGKVGFGDIVRLGGFTRKGHIRRIRKKRGPFYSFGKKLSLSHQSSMAMERKAITGDQCKKIVVPSELVKDDVLDCYPEVSESKIRVIPNGIDLCRYNLDKREQFRREMRRDLELEDEDLTGIFIGNDPENKGFQRIVPMLRNHKSFKLIVLGAHSSKDFIPDDVESQIRYVGWVEQPQRYYAAADCLIHPTRADGFGLVVLEAWAMGLYVFIARNAGASELISEDEHGHVLEDGSDVPFEKMDKELLRGDEYCRLRHQKARHYSLEEVTSQYRELFRKLS